MRRFVVAALALAVAGCGGDRAPPSPNGVLHRIVAEGVPGALVLIRDGDGTRSAAVGVAALESRVPMRADARFRVGSVTKTFVALLALRLAADGRLRLGDTVERWLPGLLPDGRRITIRQLLAHRSGLADYVDDPAVRRRRTWSPRGLVEFAVARPRAFATPGARFSYASTNYLILGLIVERAGEAPLPRLLRERVFAPLGLHHTSFSPEPLRGADIHGHRAVEHQGIVSRRLVDTSRESASWTLAAGAVVSTADDLARFFRAVLRGDLAAAMARPSGPEARYGLGVAIFATPCGRVWGHTGNVSGVVTAVWNTRDASRQVVLVANAYPLSPDQDEAVRGALEAAFCDRR